jgi:sugar lactone lactonase YvrE
MKRIKEKIGLTGLLLIIGPTCIYSQTGVVKKVECYIEWIGEYPSIASTQKALYKIKSYISKKPGQYLIKPMNITGSEGISGIWVVDQGLCSIIKIDEGVGEIPRAFKKSEIEYSSLTGLCIIGSERILFTDSHSSSVFVYDQNQSRIFLFNQEIDFMRPTGVAYSETTGEVWIVETAAHRISVFDQEGNFIKTIGKRGNQEGEFNYPTFIWIDKLGIIYVIDSLNFRIQMFNSAGEFIFQFGRQGDGTGFFARPKGIATDSEGNIYVSDGLFHTVQIFNREGEFLISFGGQGKGKGEFWMPGGLYIDSEDRIYVADTYNSRIQVFKLIKKNEQK